MRLRGKLIHYSHLTWSYLLSLVCRDFATASPPSFSVPLFIREYFTREAPSLLTTSLHRSSLHKLFTLQDLLL